MNRMKKCVSVLMIICLMVVMLSIEAFATEDKDFTNIKEDAIEGYVSATCEFQFDENYMGKVSSNIELSEDMMEAFKIKLREKNVVVGVVHTPNSYLRRNYVNAIKNSGGTPFLLDLVTTEIEAKAALEMVDALVFTGGDDINPALYGEEPSKRLEAVDDARDLSDYLMIKEAVSQNMPVLATCRGMQMLNIIQGGTLIQDIKTEYETDLVHRDMSTWDGAFHMISIEADSQIARILNATEIEVNSFHHQAIEKVGEGLVVTASSSDGIIEALEMPEKDNIVAVQFHPERTIRQYGPYMLEFYTDLIEKAVQYREEKAVSSFTPIERDGKIYYKIRNVNSLKSEQSVLNLFTILDEKRAVDSDFSVDFREVYVYQDLVSLKELTDNVILNEISYTFPQEVLVSNFVIGEDGKTISFTADEYTRHGKFYAIFDESCYQTKNITYTGVSDGMLTTENQFLTIETDGVIDTVEVTRNGEPFKNAYTYKINGVRYDSKYQHFPFNSSGKYIVKTTLINGASSEISFIIDRINPYTNIKKEMYNINKTLTYGDSLSGVASATLNGISVESGTVIKASGDYKLVVTDRNGNSVTKSFTLDNVNPTTNVNQSYYTKNQTIVFSDDFTGINCATLNEKEISSGKVVNTSGSYKLIITDKAGNKLTKSFVLDKVKPSTSIGSTYYKKNKKVTFSDKHSGIKSATLNGKKISSGKVVSASGSYKLVVTDKAGNKTTKSFIMDKVKPSTSIGSTYYKKNKKVTFSDKHSGIKSATLNGKKISSGKVIRTNGSYKLIVTDKAGNEQVQSFVLDKVKPTTNIKKKVYKTKKTITFSDKHSGIKSAKLNGKKISTGTTVKKNGKYKLILTDNAGNQKIVNFTIKN